MGFRVFSFEGLRVEEFRVQGLRVLGGCWGLAFLFFGEEGGGG